MTILVLLGLHSLHFPAHPEKLEGSAHLFVVGGSISLQPMGWLLMCGHAALLQSAAAKQSRDTQTALLSDSPG